MTVMSQTIIPTNYVPEEGLDIFETQEAIDLIKVRFLKHLKELLRLTRVTAPLFVTPESGLNDDLNGVERPVSFDIKETGGEAQVVQSLAKWKRYALYRYGFQSGYGLCTDMNAIRRDEEMDNLHSIYVDQWDWEAIIPEGHRDLDYLKKTVQKIVYAIYMTSKEIINRYPSLSILLSISNDISFVTTQELEDMYPDKTPRERENLYCKEHKTAFIMKIGDKLASGEPHDGRAPDYDDWSLNGDLFFWNNVLECAFEVSSMGIRVDAKAMKEQLKKAGCEERAELPFHKMVLDGTLPLTIGGGIGQSRLCMLLLGKAHIGEVQASIWDDETKAVCKAAGIELL